MARRINKPQHVQQLMSRLINELESDETMDKEKRARTIGYLANISLTAMKDDEVERRMDEIEKQLEGLK